MKRIKKLLKNNLSPRFIIKIKMGIEIITFYKRMNYIEKHIDSIDLMIGTPIHTNLGDHLIVLAEKLFFESENYTKEIVEVPTEMYELFKDRILRNITPEVAIFITGGGWMGNLWANEELIIQDILNSFKKNKIVILPQTIFYDYSLDNYKSIMDSSINIYNDCSDLTIFLRDKKSYDFACEKYKNATSLLIPDIAFAYYDEGVKYRSDFSKKNDVLFCLRNDREKAKDDLEIANLKKRLVSLGYKISYTSTMAPIRVPSFLRKGFVHNKIRKISKARLLVTDRLHGMIFAHLAGIPCIAFDNITMKVSGVYQEWLAESESIYFVNEKIDLDKLNELFNITVEKKSGYDGEMIKGFKKLWEVISNA